jgi:methyltransferase
MNNQVTVFWIVIALVAVQRIAELVIANRNTKALLARGAREEGRGQYPFIVALHLLWLVALIVFVPPGAPPDWYWLGLFIVLQVLRVWVIASLGRFWTTRIITLPEVPLVRRGPYRFLRHPNYLVVALEIPTLPLAFGAWPIAAVFGLANLALLTWRIALEDRALAPRRAAHKDKGLAHPAVTT